MEMGILGMEMGKKMGKRSWSIFYRRERVFRNCYRVSDK